MSLPLNRAAVMFGAMSQVQVRGSRDDLKAGSAVVLIKEVRSKETREFKPYISIRGTVLYGLNDKAGRKPDAENYEGNRAGEEPSIAMFHGDYFKRDFKSFALAGLGMTAAEAGTITDADFQATSLAICGLNEKGEEAGAGLLDGTVVLEIKTTSKMSKDSRDETKMKEWFSHYYIRKVPVSEVMEHLDEKALIQAFGSMERVAQLIADESV